MCTFLLGLERQVVMKFLRSSAIAPYAYKHIPFDDAKLFGYGQGQKLIKRGTSCLYNYLRYLAICLVFACECTLRRDAGFVETASLVKYGKLQSSPSLAVRPTGTLNMTERRAGLT